MGEKHRPVAKTTKQSSPFIKKKDTDTPGFYRFKEQLLYYKSPCIRVSNLWPDFSVRSRFKSYLQGLCSVSG